MRKIYSSKLVYKSYFDYLKKKLINKYFISTSLVIMLLFFLFFTIVKLIALYSSHGYQKINALEIAIETSALTTLYVALSFLSVFLFFSIFIWFQKFSIENNKIVDYFPIYREYNLEEIQKIILADTNLGHILLKKDKDNFIQSVYWHGNTEEDWLDFLNQLLINSPTVQDKIYIKTSLRKGNKLVKSSINNSYKELQKLNDKN